MSLKSILESWKFSLIDGEFVSKSSIERLESILKEEYHLVPYGNIALSEYESSMKKELRDQYGMEYYGNIAVGKLTGNRHFPLVCPPTQDNESIEAIKEYHNYE